MGTAAGNGGNSPSPGPGDTPGPGGSAAGPGGSGQGGTPESRGFFRRFRLTGAQAAEAAGEISADQAALPGYYQAGDLPSALAAQLRAGANLIPLGREAAAVTHLAEALRLARHLHDTGAEIRALLHLGTAHQYLGDRELAQELFQQGVDLSLRSGNTTSLHFLLHHRGRCYAEQGEPGLARESFRQSLALRRELGDQRFIAATEQALAELAATG